ncbi:hypothetical protein HPB52_011581 [Rhipicephalus sanguineus]|uniref:Secreted protein n=1 Tax=Rhipicephalus sanguineus TaxID=34632 RepID=A0A9D4T010_RHISA|nr:hypothetical protein HPB52_011581 [Rhipicephalus sanguineus]
MRLFVLVLLFVAHFGDAQGDVGENGDDDCTEAQQRGGTDSVGQANDFVDTVLLQRMPTLIRETVVHGHLSLPFHYFKVYKTAWLMNRDLKVYVLSGRFRHFSTAVRRNDDCVLSMVAGNVSVSCSLSIDGIVAELQTEAKGDNLLATKKSVRVDAQMYGMTGRLEVTSAMNQPAFLRSFVVENGYFHVTVGHNLELNSVRMSNFESNIRWYLGQHLQEKFYTYYEALLRHAFARKSFFLF